MTTYLIPIHNFHYIFVVLYPTIFSAHQHISFPLRFIMSEDWPHSGLCLQGTFSCFMFISTYNHVYFRSARQHVGVCIGGRTLQLICRPVQDRRHKILDTMCKQQQQPPPSHTTPLKSLLCRSGVARLAPSRIVKCSQPHFKPVLTSNYLEKAACGHGTPHVDANEPNNQILPFYPSTTHSLSPSISRLYLFLSSTQCHPVASLRRHACHITTFHVHFRVQCSHAHSLATPVLVHLGDACATSPPFVCNIPTHNPSQSHTNIHLNICNVHSPMFTCTQTCLIFHISTLVFVCWFTHIDSHVGHGLAFSPKCHTSTLSRIFSQCFAVPFSVYGRHHCSH